MRSRHDRHRTQVLEGWQSTSQLVDVKNEHRVTTWGSSERTQCCRRSWATIGKRVRESNLVFTMTVTNRNETRNNVSVVLLLIWPSNTLQSHFGPRICGQKGGSVSLNYPLDTEVDISLENAKQYAPAMEISMSYESISRAWTFNRHG